MMMIRDLSPFLTFFYHLRTIVEAQIVRFFMINGECWFQISSKKAVEVINKQSHEPIWQQRYKEMQFQIVVSKVRIFLDRIGMMVLPKIHKKNKLVSQNITLNLKIALKEQVVCITVS